MARTSRPRPTLLVLLSRWRVNIGFLAGGSALLFAGQPTRASVLDWAPLVLLGLVVRVWARGHLELRTPLVESGPYSFVRHPLYVGSFAIGLAFAAMMRDVPVVAVYALVFPLMYVPKAMREETFLRGLHGAAYDAYAARVRAFLPRPRALRDRPASSRHFTWRRVLRHREYQTWAGAAVACAVLWMRALWHI